jgi:two-component system LytT family response regulator
MKILIADDEPLARERLSKILREHLPVTNTFIFARDGREALDCLQHQKIDIAFLDIEMPFLSGIDVAFQVNVSCPIVFVTAFQEFAIKAFESNAVDYVVKPFRVERLLSALERAKTRIGKSSLPKGLSPEKFCVKIGSDYHVFDFRKISLFQAQGDYVMVYIGQEKHLIEHTMSALAQRLPPSFIRIHRSAMINSDYLEKVTTQDRAYFAILNDYWGHELKVAKNHVGPLLSLLRSS